MLLSSCCPRMSVPKPYVCHSTLPVSPPSFIGHQVDDLQQTRRSSWQVVGNCSRDSVSCDACASPSLLSLKAAGALEAVVAKFPAPLLAARAELLFLPLAARLVNDPSAQYATCRASASSISTVREATGVWARVGYKVRANSRV